MYSNAGVSTTSTVAQESERLEILDEILPVPDATTSQIHKPPELSDGNAERTSSINRSSCGVSVTPAMNLEFMRRTAELNYGGREVVLNTTGEPNCTHIIAEWPRTNADFELLTKMDDEQAASDCLLTHKTASDIFDPDNWFIQPDLSDDDVPPGRRLRMNPGQLCLTPIESWTSIHDDLALDSSLQKQQLLQNPAQH